MRSLFLAALIWLMALPAFASQSVPVDTGKVTASLVSSHDSVAPGQEFYIALRTELDEHWHIYWRNPGDSGEPTHIEWELPDGVTAGEINWRRRAAFPCEIYRQSKCRARDCYYGSLEFLLFGLQRYLHP